MNWLRQTPAGFEVRIRVVPRASRDEVVGLYGDAVKVRLQAPPLDNKANRALVRFLAKRLGVPASCVRIIGGPASRDKRVVFEGIDRADLESLLRRP